MLKEKLTERENKNKIRPRFKIKIKPTLNNDIPKFYNAKEYNSNSKSNINSTKLTEILSNNSQINDKPMLNNMNNDDKDLETLLSELKNASFLKNKDDEQENFKEENYIKLNKNENKENINLNLFNNNGNFYIEKRKEKNNFDNIDINLDFQEQGHEISQRVHTNKAKNHKKIYKIEKKLIKVNTNDINKANENNSKNKTLHTPECNRIFMKNENKESSSIRNQYYLKDSLMEKFTSMNKNRKIFYKFQNSNNKNNSIPILDKYAYTTKNYRRQIEKKYSQYNSINTVRKYINSNSKKYSTSFINKIQYGNKSVICSPKAYRMNKTINFDFELKNGLNTLKNINNNSCNKNIGQLYIKNKYKKIKSDKIKMRLIYFKSNTNNSNPFTNNSLFSKNSTIKKIKSYVDSSNEKIDMKKTIINDSIKKRKIIKNKEICLKLRKRINNSNKSYSKSKKKSVLFFKD